MRERKKIQSNKDFSIESGSANLETMAVAVNYNQNICKTLEKYLPHNELVLDFGAGTGLFANKVNQLGYEVEVLEPESRLSENLKLQGFNSYTDLHAIPNSRYGAIYSLNVLEHIEDDLEVLRELSSKLSGGGILVLYLPALPFLYSSMDARVGHYRRYTKKGLETILREANYSVDKMWFGDSLGVIGTLLFKLNYRSSGEISQKTLKLYDSYIFPISYFLDKFISRYLGKNIWAVAKPNSFPKSH
jgi:SAM-dependent methyltransferase